MRTLRLFILLLLLTLLSACNLPAAQKNTPTTDFIATTVAKTLTALPSKVPLFTQDTGPIATIPAPTLSPSETPKSSASPSPTPSQLPAGDPRLWLGTPAKVDTLDSPQGFGLAGGYEDSAAAITISGGAMTLKSFSTTGWRTWRVRPPELSAAYIEAPFHTLTCSGSDQYGLVLRAPNYDTGFGYYFAVTCDGRFNFSRWDANGTAVLVPSTPDNNILSGSGQTNRLGVISNGQKFQLYINGNLVKELEDAALPSGFYGVFIGGFSGAFTIQMDEIAYWTNLQ
ncbi:MAG: hypothetical protein IT308_10145 [Anaerolineaceae bacterium]|nr:hypothetical protein [Anaerolineaceae bacterium]